MFSQSNLSRKKETTILATTTAYLHHREIEDLQISYDDVVGLPQWKQDLRWLLAISEGLRQSPICLVARTGEKIEGYLPLVRMRSRLFGNHLVALPYINSAGVRALHPAIAAQLIVQAAALADRFAVRHLELRHEIEVPHQLLSSAHGNKVHMRLKLPASEDEVWTQLGPKVRNQVRKADKFDLIVDWGRAEQIKRFYQVFSQNMRDLGTPVYSRRLFDAIQHQFNDDCEFCVVSLNNRPIAAAMLIYGGNSVEVPSASCLRGFNSTNANMWMYWQLLRRAIARGARQFDFGRSTIDSNTFRFKKQWGATPEPTAWQYYSRIGEIADAKRENPKYQKLIRVWQRLPIWLTRLIGPAIVRGIP